MMEGFGLGTRRTVAAGLLVLVLLLVIDIVISPLAAAVGDMRGELALLKAREARLEAAKQWPAAEADAGRYEGLLLPGSEAGAREALATRLERAAEAQGLDAPPAAVSVVPRGEGLAVEARLAVSGPHDAVLGFIAEIEAGSPLVRFSSLDLVPVPSQTGELAAEMTLEAVARAR